MTPSPQFIEGLKILEPFLQDYGFRLDTMVTQHGSGGQFTNATFVNGKKRLIIGYRYSIGVLDYKFEDAIVMHNFYLDRLGHSDKRHFPGFQNEDLTKPFKDILADFDHLKEIFSLDNVRN